ncbi:porin family protein [Persicobacter diffluens]|uniref:Outer membrane protein beta-barrel domain-containing protein n=1 Tax=Persicobacter diffluens TaxID=981 RepID=A0AAN4W1H6_9BACT|nr:hypothetical protein PEDI_37060 [Persicobacter diffluens]
MKKLLLIAALVMTTALSASAQLVNIGFRGGVNIAGYNSNHPSDGKSARVGGVFGVAAEANLGLFGVHGEVNYAMAGLKFDNAPIAEGVTVSGKQIRNYLQIPVMGALNLPLGFKIMAGPQLNVLLSAQDDLKASVGGVELPGQEKVDVNDEVNDYDWGFVAGVQWKKGHWAIDARYNHSFTNMYKEDDGGKTRNMAYSFGLTYYLFD